MRSAWRGMPALILVLGIISSLLLVGVDSLRESLATDEADLLRLIGDLRTDLALSHLWMEEYLAGDESSFEPIWRNLELSRSLAHRLRVTVSRGRWRGSDPGLPGRAAALEEAVERFNDVSERRYAAYRDGQEAGAGSQLDTEFDVIFDDVNEEAASVYGALDALLTRSVGQTRVLTHSVLGGWLLIIAAAFAAVLSHDRRRLRAETTLRERDLQLLRAQKLDAVGRLAGGLAHDVNNYLAAIHMQCELARSKASSEREAERMSAVIDTACKASGLIERLLAFSRKQPIQPEVIELNRVIRGLEAMAHQVVGEDVRLELRLARDLWRVEMDPAQVEQIVVNLLVNAREAMPGGGRVTVETSNCRLDSVYAEQRPGVAPGDYVQLTVSDTGPGIAEELCDKIFEPFFTTKGDTGSSGLGLATTYGIVKQNQGDVWVYSEPGMGAVFKIYLPRCHQEPAFRRRAPEAREVRPRGSETLLLAEDNDELRRATAELLESLGYRVLAAAHAAEAMARAESESGDVDLVITDVVMPGESGRELVERLRHRWGPVPALFISGYSETVLDHHGVVPQGVDLLLKPLSGDGLAAKVREMLDRRESVSA